MSLTKFVIVAHGRSGSSLLVRALSKHPNIVAYGELFHVNPEKRALVNGHRFEDGQDEAAFCNDVLFHLPNEFGKEMIGFKLLFNQARKGEQTRGAWRYLTHDRAVHVILLSRRNLFNSYVSEQRSRASGVWHLTRGQTPPAQYFKPIVIDPCQCVEYVLRVKTNIKWAEQQFANHHRLVLHYEAIEKDFADSMKRIFRFLNARSKHVSPSYDKLNTLSHQEGIVNYEEVVAHLKASGMEEYIAG